MEGIDGGARAASAPAANGALARAGLSSVRIAGFACDRLWVYMMFYSTVPYLMASDMRSVLYTNMFISLCSAAVALVFIGIVAHRQDRVHRNGVLMGVSAAAMATGTIVGYFLNISTTVGLLAMGGCALATGVGSALLFVGWLEQLSDAGARTAALEATIAACAALGASFLLVFGPTAVAWAVIAALPVASGAQLLRASSASGRPDKLPPYEPLSKQTFVLFVKALVGVAAFGLIAGFFDVFTGFHSFAMSDMHGLELFGFGFVVMAALCAVCVLKRHEALFYLYRIAMFALCAGCLCALFLGDYSTFAGGVVFSGYLAFSVVLLIVCAMVTRAFNLGATRVIAFSFAVLDVGEIAGQALANLLAVDIEPQTLALITMVSVLWLFFAHLFLFTETDLVEIGLGELSVQPAAAADDVVDEPASSELSQDEVCAIMVERFGLTPRESDVLPLLLQGRTIARIQETLYISQGTVSTHIRHIYQKTASANRQELLDLAERIAHEEA